MRRNQNLPLPVTEIINLKPLLEKRLEHDN